MTVESPKKRALFVCPHLPSAAAPQAGHKIAYANLVALSATHATDVLISCKASALPASAADATALARHAHQIEFLPSSTPGRLFAVLRGMARGLAPRLATRYSPPSLQRVEAMQAGGVYDTIWLEFSQTFWLAEHLHGRGARLVLSVHDLITQLVSTKAGVEILGCFGWTFMTEARLLGRADRIRVLSDKDAALLATLFRIDPARIEIQRPALSAFVANVRRHVDIIESRSILFWGAMGRAENADAVTRFIQTTFERLQMKFPDAKLYVVGSEPPPRLVALASESIVVTGYVDDPTPYFERCSVGIAPLVSGAGIKLKVLEMLGAQMPVVSTPIGAEGIAADPLLQVASLDEFDRAIERAWTVR